MESPKGKEALSVTVLRDCNEKRERERQRRREESRLLWSDCNVLIKQSLKPGILLHLLQHMFCDSFRINEIHFMWLALVYVAAASHHRHPPGRGDHSCRTTSSCKDLKVIFFEQSFWCPECCLNPWHCGDSPGCFGSPRHKLWPRHNVVPASWNDVRRCHRQAGQPMVSAFFGVVILMILGSVWIQPIKRKSDRNYIVSKSLYLK